MGSDKRIPCSTETFNVAKALKEEKGMTWDEFVAEAAGDDTDAQGTSRVEEVHAELQTLKNRLDELAEETARKTSERLQR